MYNNNTIIIYYTWNCIDNTADNPAVSCAAILSANSSAQSGTYFIRSANADPSEPSTSAFCDMTLDCDGVVGGWRQIADINPEIECPEGFIQSSFFGFACFSESGRLGSGSGCPLSLAFPVNDIEYSQVCGWITGQRLVLPLLKMWKQGSVLTVAVTKSDLIFCSSILAEFRINLQIH